MSESASRTNSFLPQSFYKTLCSLLCEYPEGLSEYDLLQLLKEQGYFSFWKDSPASTIELFQAHFLLFHALYHLQDEYHGTQSGILEISPLNIQLKDYQPGQAAIHVHDPLQEYYRDLDNLTNMTEEEVDKLLETFWRDFIRFDSRAMALAELGLSDPVDDDVIKQTYRRLAMEHHPDRGGEASRLQAINAAYACLRNSSF